MLQTLKREIAYDKIQSLPARYAEHWKDWLHASYCHDFRAGSTSLEIAGEFKRIMGAWQPCRPVALRNRAELQSTLDLIAAP